MSNVKKAYEEVIALLEANKNKKVATIMPQILELVTSKTNSKTFKRNDNGEVTHIFCYYHKEWEALATIEYGAKASSSTGFNTMCKEGVSQWSKQQRVAKKSSASLLNSLADGTLALEDLKQHQDDIESLRNIIIAHSSLDNDDNV